MGTERCVYVKTLQFSSTTRAFVDDLLKLPLLKYPAFARKQDVQAGVHGHFFLMHVLW